jgi:hypothetical protein
MDIECLLAHLIGSVDALLVRINDKIGLGLNIKNVNSGPKSLTVINNELDRRGKYNLLRDLIEANKNKPCEEIGWFWTLKDVRNKGMHRFFFILDQSAADTKFR